MTKDTEVGSILSKDGTAVTDQVQNPNADVSENENQKKGADEIVSIASSGAAQVLVKKKEYTESLSAEDFHNNDNRILALLTNEKGKYSFKGLMRKLDIHQQSLSRALHRLEYLGLVEKSASGYALSRQGAYVIARNNLGLPRMKRNGMPYMQLMQTFIPINMNAHEIAHALAGKWFKNLRWLGIIESEMGYTLQWASTDGLFQVNLKIISGFIVIEANPSSDGEKVQAMVGSYAIYEQITKIFQDKLASFGSSYVFTDRYFPNRNN